MNIKILLEKPNFKTKSVLKLEPLSPLSIVTSMPGSYYKSENEPTLMMLYGMLENLIGWHYSNEIRNEIIKKLKSHHKRKNKIKLEFQKTKLGYCPLLQNFIKIEKSVFKPTINNYEEYWTQHLFEKDERHAKGCRNTDYRIENRINEIYKLSDEKEIKNGWEDLFNKNQDGFFPKYYQSPTKREYIVVYPYYAYFLYTNEKIYNALFEKLKNIEVPVYIGNNEGWIHLELEKCN